MKRRKLMVLLVAVMMIATMIPSMAFAVDNGNTDTVTISGTKEWAGDDESNRPESITVKLMNGNEEIATQEVTKADGWKFSFEVAKDTVIDAGDNLTVVENGVENYKAEYTQPKVTVTDDTVTEGTTTPAEVSTLEKVATNKGQNATIEGNLIVFKIANESKYIIWTANPIKDGDKDDVEKAIGKSIDSINDNSTIAYVNSTSSVTVSGDGEFTIDGNKISWNMQSVKSLIWYGTYTASEFIPGTIIPGDVYVSDCKITNTYVEPTTPVDPGTTDPTDPTTPTVDNDAAAKTGDGFNPFVFAGIALAALMAAAATYISRRRA